MSRHSTMELHLAPKEGNVFFNDTLNIFYIWLYGDAHMVSK